MDNNNFPQDPNLNQNNNQEPQQPFGQQPFNAQPQQPFGQQPFNAQPQQPFEQQPFNAQPQQPFEQQPFNVQPQNGVPFADNNGGHHFNTQANNPFMTTNNYIPGSDPAAHLKGIISTICGAASILLNLISMIVFCGCVCNVGNNIFKYAENLRNGTLISGILIFVALAAAIVGIIFAALGKKTSKDSLLTAGLTLSIIGASLTFIMFIACACTCICGSAASSASSSAYSSLLKNLR